VPFQARDRFSHLIFTATLWSENYLLPPVDKRRNWSTERLDNLPEGVPLVNGLAHPQAWILGASFQNQIVIWKAKSTPGITEPFKCDIIIFIICVEVCLFHLKTWHNSAIWIMQKINYIIFQRCNFYYSSFSLHRCIYWGKLCIAPTGCDTGPSAGATKWTK